jgi:hypothetical protein
MAWPPAVLQADSTTSRVLGRWLVNSSAAYRAPEAGLASEEASTSIDFNGTAGSEIAWPAKWTTS